MPLTTSILAALIFNSIQAYKSGALTIRKPMAYGYENLVFDYVDFQFRRHKTQLGDISYEIILINTDAKPLSSGEGLGRGQMLRLRNKLNGINSIMYASSRQRGAMCHVPTIAY
jgi:hypothetical protein